MKYADCVSFKINLLASFFITIVFVLIICYLVNEDELLLVTRNKSHATCPFIQHLVVIIFAITSVAYNY